MNHILAVLFASVTLASAATTVTLEGVHNCCKSCTNGIVKAVAGLKDVEVTADGETVTITAKSKANAKKAVEAILEAGYYGKVSEESFAASPKADKTLKEATVTGAHLCCQKCVNAMSEAVKSVPGITGADIVSKQSTFTVKGEFSSQALLAAMNKAGFHGSLK
jgi:copper chaperone CopZ